MARLFVAVWPSPPVVDVLAALPREPLDGLRFTTEGQWHVTLRFLGDCDEDVAAAAIGAVRFAPATAVVGPAVERIGPGIVVAPVAGLDGLAAIVGAATAEVGEPADPRPFRGHITLARQKRSDHCSLDGAPLMATFPVGEIALVRSDRDHDGARYTTVTTVAAAS